ncbi:SigE family RNA polymerase sigma factor [Nocardioides daejeonensis]|uniref:SigE family RNA polymerase sigma factor n=1 Tax=Nocardioides daejeonensis TaxID=1046556 RepID=UPI000D74B9CD|nr:SigE family RNA polymerase sigma factor [Nocardioides daejeonensis]
MRDRGFAEFVEAQLPRLHGYARALTGNEHDAWDLTQEALVRVGLKWSRVSLGENPVGYAHTTLARLNIDRIRRRRRELPGVVPERGVDAVLPDGVEPWLVGALAALSPKQRTAVVLRCVDDLDAAGIAAVLGCSVGTARSHLSRGLERMRQHIPEGDPRV